MGQSATDLLLKIGGDSAGAQASVNQLVEKLGGLKAATDGPSASAHALGETLKNAFENPVDAAKNLVETIGSELTGALSKLGPAGETAAAGIGILVGAVTAVGGAVLALAHHAAEAGESQLAFSRKTGIAVENVGALEFAAKAAGGSLDQLTGLLRMVELRSQASGAAGDKFNAALKDIGINAAKFKTEDNESQILDLAQGFQKGATSGKTMADAMTLMGRAGVSQLDMLMKVNPALVELGQKLGVVFTKEQAEKAEGFKLQLGIVETALGNISTRIGMAVLPAVEGFVEKIAQSPNFISKVTAAVEGLTHGLGYLVEGAGLIVVGFLRTGEAVVNLAELFGMGGTAIDKFILSILQGFAKIPGATKVIPGLASSIEYMKGQVKESEAAVAKLDSTGNKLRAGQDLVYNSTMGLGKALTNVKVSAEGAGGAIDLSLNKAMGDAAEKADAAEKKIQAFVDALEGDSKTYVDQAIAIGRVIEAGSQDEDVKVRVVAAIEKLVKAHQTLTPEMQTYLAVNADLTVAGKKTAAAHQNLIDVMGEEATYWSEADTSGNAYATRLLRLGGSLKDVAGWTGMSATEVKKLDDALKASIKTADNVAKANEKALAERDRLDADTSELIVKRDGEVTASKLANLKKWYEDEKAKYQKSGADAGTLSSLLISLDQNRVAKEGIIRDQERQNNKKAADEIAGLWAETYQLETSGSEQATNLRIQQLNRETQAKLDALKIGERYYADYYNAIVANAKAKTNDLIRANDPLWAAVKSLNQDMRNSFASTWNQVLTGARSFSDGILEPFRQLRDGVLKILAGLLADVENKLFKPLLDKISNWINQLMEGGGGMMSAGASGFAAQLLGPGVARSTNYNMPHPGGSGLAGGIGAGMVGFGAGSMVVGATGTRSEAVGALEGAGAGAAAGALYGSVVPGVGTAVGAGVGAIAGAIAGWWEAKKAADAAREANVAATQSIKDTEKQLLSQYGSLGNIAALGKEVGVDLAGAWGDQSQGGLEHFNGMLAEFNDKVAALNGAVQAFGLTWEDLSTSGKIESVREQTAKLVDEIETAGKAGYDLQSVMAKAGPQILAALDATMKTGGAIDETNPLVGKIESYMGQGGKMTADMASQLNVLVSDAIDAGKQLPAAFQPWLDQLAKTGQLTDDVKNKLLGIPADTGPTWQDMQSAAQKYGISLDSLGNRFKGLRDTDSAKSLISDFNMLTKGGADANAVLEGMKTDIQGIVTDSRKFGTQIPAEMKPMLQGLMDMGELTDENGNKLSDMSSLNFADPVVSAIDKVTAALDKLLVGLGISAPAAAATGAGGIETAAASAAKANAAAASATEQAWKDSAAVVGGLNFSPNTDSPSSPGATTSAAPVMDEPVRYVTRAGLAMLNPGDIVGMPGKTPGGYGQGGGTNISLSISALDTDGVRRGMKIIIPELLDALRYNTHGLKTGLRIGVTPDVYLPGGA